ncbi:MAG TPA: cupin domain-containing protein [Gaiellaceae bacterium]
MRWLIHPGEQPLFGHERGCERFEQRLLRFSGPAAAAKDEEADDVLFVLGGSGTVEVGGRHVQLAPGAAVYAAARTPWRVTEADSLEIISVRVPDPEPGAPYATVPADDAPAGTATAGRSFRLLACPAVGCNSVTQFIGLIPPGRAPDHYHLYDEVIYVLDGEGTLEIDGEQAPIRPATCIHLPRTLVHCLANTGDREMRVLGVFRPAGSPAEAYYPDGTAAVVPEED